MKLRRLCATVIVLATAAVTLIPTASWAGDKRRVVVMPFDYGAVSSSVGTMDVGKGISSLLETRLVKDGTYSVIDREHLDAVLKEQNLSVSDRADPATACKIGKLLSVDAIIVGKITQFGVERSTTSTGAVSSLAGIGTGYIPYVGGISLPSFHSNKTKAKVGIDAKVIDINTSEILAAANGTAEQKKGSWKLSDSWDWYSDDFANSAAGEATIAAVDQLTGQLIAAASKIPDNQSLAQKNVEGKIADVTGKTVIVNVGKINGIKPGDTLQVERITKTIHDPNHPDKILKTVTTTIALINVTEADNDSATGTLTKGTGVNVGDLVKKVTTDVSAIVLTPLGNGGATTKTK